MKTTVPWLLAAGSLFIWTLGLLTGTDLSAFLIAGAAMTCLTLLADRRPLVAPVLVPVISARGPTVLGQVRLVQRSATNLSR